MIEVVYVEASDIIAGLLKNTSSQHVTRLPSLPKPSRILKDCCN